MKLCVVQTRPARGDIQANIENHKKLINLAIAHGADTIIFPELSITGYEPELAKGLATAIDDKRFDDFQELSTRHSVTIGVGMPIKNGSGISISMIIFRPNEARHVYHKKHIHADEEPFFVSGENTNSMIGENEDIAIAICYELSVREHAENAFKKNAEYYVASAVKSKDAMERTAKRLSEIGKNYSMTVLLANCIGEDSGGKSAIWNKRGVLLDQLGDSAEGFLIYDSVTNDITKFEYD